MADLFGHHKLSITTTAKQNRRRLYRSCLNVTRPISPLSVPACHAAIPWCRCRCRIPIPPRRHLRRLKSALAACAQRWLTTLCVPVSVAGSHDAPAPSSICAGGLGARGPSSSPRYCSSRPSSGSTSPTRWRTTTHLVARCSPTR
jgi:hypothetical protein